jgi:hypothetical protein
MDCKQARLLLELTRPRGGELDPADAEALEQHLADCPDCGPAARDERRADEHLGRAMRDVPVPVGLRERILKKLGPDTGPAPISKRRPWLWRYLGAAAALLVTVGLGVMGYLTWLAPPPAVSVQQIHDRANQQFFAKRPDAVEKDFQDRLGVTMVAPPQFNYDLLIAYQLAVFEKKQVPELLFFTHGDREKGLPPALAQVYVLSSRQFDLEETYRTRSQGLSGPRMVRLEWPPDNNRDYLYLIVYSGHSLQPFYAPLKPI